MSFVTVPSSAQPQSAQMRDSGAATQSGPDRIGETMPEHNHPKRSMCGKHKRHFWFAAGALQAGLALAVAALATLGDCDIPKRNYP